MDINGLTQALGQMTVVSLLSRLVGVGARAIGQPLVVAEMVTGVLLGPSVLGWIWPEGMTLLFPDWSLGPLRLLSQIGLVLFMFLVGLELDLRQSGVGSRSVVLISHASIVVPFALGIAAASWLWPGYAVPGIPFLPFALFLGSAMSVTAFPVLARILAEQGLAGTRVGAIAIACAAVDDVTAWCTLSLSVAVARSRDFRSVVWTTGSAILFILCMLYVVRPALWYCLRRPERRASPSPGLVALLLALLWLSSSATELIGIHALFGAFLFGAVIPKHEWLVEGLRQKLETVTVVLLPLFFAYSGLRTQIGLVSGVGQWCVAIVLILLASVGKFAGSALAARLSGSRWREATAIGILLNTRGLMELMVLNIGMDLGVISPVVFSMLVLMALGTTFATTPLVRFLYPQRVFEAAPAPDVAGAPT